ncbi:Glutamate racemase 2 [compost metagenome]
MKKIFPDGVEFISGSIGTVKNLRNILEKTNQVNDGSGNIEFFISGNKVDDKDTLANYRRLLSMQN